LVTARAAEVLLNEIEIDPAQNDLFGEWSSNHRKMRTYDLFVKNWVASLGFFGLVRPRLSLV
jgi:hypothetical protein